MTSPRAQYGMNTYTPGGSVLRRTVNSTKNKTASSFSYNDHSEGGNSNYHNYNNNNYNNGNSEMPFYGNEKKSSSSAFSLNKQNKNRFITAMMTIMAFSMVIFCFQTTSVLFSRSSINDVKHSITKENIHEFNKRVLVTNLATYGLDERDEDDVEANKKAQKDYQDAKKMVNDKDGYISKDVQHTVRHAGISKGVYRRTRRSDTNPKKNGLTSFFGTNMASASPLSQEDLDRISESANQLKGYINPASKAKESFGILPKGYGITGKVSMVERIEEFDSVEFDAEDHFGAGIAVLGDIDQDGLVDVAFGAPGADFYTGAIYIASIDQDGEIEDYHYITPNYMMDEWNVWGELDSIGYAIENIGDLDGDGVTDIAVSGISYPSGENVGEVLILFLQRDFRVKKHVRITSGSNGFDFILPANTHFGASIANLGDIDGDGVVDLMVGAVGLSKYRGGAFVLNMNRDGTVKSYTQLSSSHNMDLKLQPDDEFGVSCESIGDLDGDGINEVVVGADSYPNGEAIGTGFILWLNKDGSAKKVRRIDELDGEVEGEDFLGSSFAALGDLDGDGIQELAISAHGMVDYEGAFFIAYLNKDGTIKDYTRVSTDDGLPIVLDFEDEFAHSMTSLGHFSKPGHISLVVGSLGHPGGDKQGMVYVIHMPRE